MKKGANENHLKKGDKITKKPKKPVKLTKTEKIKETRKQ